MSHSCSIPCKTMSLLSPRSAYIRRPDACCRSLSFACWKIRNNLFFLSLSFYRPSFQINRGRFHCFAIHSRVLHNGYIALEARKWIQTKRLHSERQSQGDVLECRRVWEEAARFGRIWWWIKKKRKPTEREITATVTNHPNATLRKESHPTQTHQPRRANGKVDEPSGAAKFPLSPLPQSLVYPFSPPVFSSVGGKK